MQVVDDAPVLGVVMLRVDHRRGAAHRQGGTDRARETWKCELAVDVEISTMNFKRLPTFNPMTEITFHSSNILPLTHLSVRRRLLAAPGVVIPPSSSSQPSSRSSSEALAPSPGLRYGSIGAAATPTSPSTGDTEEGRDPSRRCCSRSSAESRK